MSAGVAAIYRAASAWDEFWFARASLVRLAAFRLVALAATLYAVFQFRPGVMQHAFGTQEAFLRRMYTPIYAFEVLGVEPIGPATARCVFLGLLVALAAAIVGIATRLACAIVAVLSFYWIGMAYSFGKPHHDCVALIFALLALPLAPVGARLSLESAWRRRRDVRDGRALESNEAGWAALPLRFTQITVALGYFFAGASKLVVSGPRWANGYTLQGIMLENDSPWTAQLSGSIQLCAIASASLLLVQTTFPLVLFFPRMAWFYVPASVLFHLLAWKTMGTGPFLTLWFLLAAFVPLERVPAALETCVFRGSLLRRLASGVLIAALVFGVARLYFAIVPAWMFWIVLSALLAWEVSKRFPSVSSPLAGTAELGGFRRLVFWFPVLYLALNVVLFVFAKDTYRHVFLGEDGVLESVQAIAFALAALVAASIVPRAMRLPRRALVGAWTVLACALAFAALEEVSWGQRWLAFETPEPMRELNRQGEMTFHNLSFVQPRIGLVLALVTTVAGAAWVFVSHRREPSRGALREVVPGPLSALFFLSNSLFYAALMVQNHVLERSRPLHVWQQEFFETLVALGFLVFAIDSRHRLTPRSPPSDRRARPGLPPDAAL